MKLYRLAPFAIFVVYLLGIFAAQFALGANLSSLIFVSDLDDTIRVSQILSRTDHHLNTAVNYTSSKMPFSHMPELYSQLLADGAGFQYVSSIPKPISGMGERFIKNSGFPAGKLWSREGKTKADHKISSIREIMRQNPDHKLVLLGDNGEHDPEIFAEILKDSYMGPRVEAAFIHELYAKNETLPAGEKPFFTAGDLAVSLNEKGLLERDAALKILKRTVRSLHPDPGLKAQSRQHLTYPFFAEAPEERLRAVLTPLSANTPDAEIKGEMSHLQNALVSRAQHTKPLGCLRNLLLRLAIGIKGIRTP